MIMPWGKFKGRPIDLLPSSYLKWMAENLDEKKPMNRQLCQAADKEYSWREQNGCHFYEEMEDRDE